MDISLERMLSLIPKDSNGKYIRGAKADFCRAIGVDNPNIIWDWEQGRSKSYMKFLYQASEKYGVSVDWLKGLTDDPTPPERKSRANHDQLIDAIVDSLDREQLLDLIQRATEMLRSK